eukprot:3387663-Alexandrium_andersonii.AAC.1
MDAGGVSTDDRCSASQRRRGGAGVYAAGHTGAPTNQKSHGGNNMYELGYRRSGANLFSSSADSATAITRQDSHSNNICA